MIAHRVYPMHMQYSSRDYDCNVTFLKVSDIRVPLQSRSFPSAGSPPGSGVLPKRFLKLTTLYGTGQQTIGEFQISGNQCDIQHRQTYKFVSTDSVSVTKLHIYVDEVFNSGLTGHVTIDLKEFMGEDDSEIYIEYPLSATTPRHRAATLHVVVQCKGPPENDTIDDVLDMDLETFLYDEYPESFLGSSDKEVEVSEHFLRDPPAESVGESNPDALMQQALGCGPFSQVRPDEFQPKIGDNNPRNNQDALSQQQGCYGARSQVPVPSLKEFEGDFLGLDTILKDFVAEYSQTRPFLVTGGGQRKATDRKDATKSHLYAAVFFAAGVTMQQRLQPAAEMNSELMLLRTPPRSADYGIFQTNSSRMILRSQSDEFDIKRVLSPRIPIPECDQVVVTVREEASRRASLSSGLEFSEIPVSSCCSPSPSYREIESVEGSTNEAKFGQDRTYEQTSVQSHSNFVPCPTCSTAESTIQDHAPLGSEETQPLIESGSKKLKRSAVVVLRNILGILLIAGVSFVLGAGAHEAGAWTTSSDGPGDGSKWSESIHQQMGAWKETVISQRPTVPALSPPLVASKIGRSTKDLTLRETGHRKIGAGLQSSPARTRTIDMISHDTRSEELRGMDDGTRTRTIDMISHDTRSEELRGMEDGTRGDNVPARNSKEHDYVGASKQRHAAPSSLIQQNARIERLAGKRLIGWPILSIDAEMRSDQQ